jgi:HSP20 family protein
VTIKWTGLWAEIARNPVRKEQALGEQWIVCQHVGVWQPPTDVYEDDEGVVVRVEAAGMRSEDFSISLAGHRLIIAGARADGVLKRAYHQMEIHFGEFRAEVHLPWQVEPESVEATYEDGFLMVRLPCPGVQHVSVVGDGQEED